MKFLAVLLLCVLAFASAAPQFGFHPGFGGGFNRPGFGGGFNRGFGGGFNRGRPTVIQRTTIIRPGK
ncbi:unnamed protein product, partial [Mesorhabditis spiculigera]